MVVRSVEKPEAFLEYVVGRFPERATVPHLEALTERIAALSYEPQRYVSFVSDEDAGAIAAQLQAIGVRADVIREPSWRQNLMYSALLFPFYPFIHPLLSVGRGTTSILSSSQSPRPVAPKIVAFTFAVLLCAMLTLTPLRHFGPWAIVGHARPTSLLAVAILNAGCAGALLGAILAMLATLFTAFSNPPVPLSSRTDGDGSAWRATLLSPSLERRRATARNAASPWALLGAVFLVIADSCHHARVSVGASELLDAYRVRDRCVRKRA